MHTNTPLRIVFAGLFAALPLPQLMAQTEPAQETAKTDEVIVLSPFTVNSQGDRGYAATSTLSGTRLNTSLRDTAAAVSVITPEVLQDLGFNNANEIANFMVNSERDAGNGAGANFNNEQNAASSIRVRGLVASASLANFFTLPWTIDSYNVERITQTRGPNSLLFGVGNSSGSLSSSTKRASLRQKKYAVGASVAVDSEESKRSELDLQLPSFGNRVALRIVGLDEQKRGFLDYDSRNERRLFMTTTVKLAERSNYRAEFRANAEWARADRNLPDLTTPVDGVTDWLAAGSPLVSGTASANIPGNLPTGTVRAASAPRLVFIDGSPTEVPVLNWNNTASSVQTRLPGNTAATVRFGPGAPVPLDRNYRGPGIASNFTGRALQFFLEQTFFRDLSLEIASSRTDWSLYWIRSSINNLSVDVNRNLPNGQPNPNVGRIYGESVLDVQDELRTSAEDRATLAYVLDATKINRWLGSWAFSGLLNRLESTQGLDESLEYNTTPLPGFNANVSNAQNRINRRTYFFNGAPVWVPSASFGHNFPVVSASGVTPALKNTRVVNDITKIKGWTLGAQAKLLKDRLVVGYGTRHDEAKRYTATPSANTDGFFSHWDTYAAPLVTEISSDTQTLGVVAHLLPWVSAFYNDSESIDLAAPRRDIFGVGLPVPTGSGKDYGLKFFLMDSRLSATVSRFDSGTLNQQRSPSPGTVANAGLIEDATGLTINAVNRSEIPPDTFDSVAKGYELEVTYNPTPSWRILANAAKSDSIQSNASLRYKRFVEERIFPLETAYGKVVTANGQTVSQLIANERDSLRRYHDAVEGAPSPEMREWRANILSSYSFTRGALRGLGFGGYVQYRSAPVLALQLDSLGNSIPSAHLMGDSEVTVGAHVRYEHKFRSRMRWSIQLNVFNLLGESEFIRKSVDPLTGLTNAWGYRQPRTFRLTNTVSF